MLRSIRLVIGSLLRRHGKQERVVESLPQGLGALNVGAQVSNNNLLGSRPGCGQNSGLRAQGDPNQSVDLTGGRRVLKVYERGMGNVGHNELSGCSLNLLGARNGFVGHDGITHWWEFDGQSWVQKA
jgi:hypothetical protein